MGLSCALTTEIGAASKEKGEKRQKAKAREGMTCAHFLIENTIFVFLFDYDVNLQTQERA